MGNDLCVVHNGIIEGRWSLEEVEAKIMSGVISRIGQNDKEFKPMTFTYQEFFEILGYPKDSKNHKKVRSHLQALQKKLCMIRKEDGYFLDVQWLGACDYYKEHVIVSIPEKFGPYLLDLRERFTSYLLENSTKFKGKYTFQIYLMAKQYLNIGTRKMAIKEFRKHLLISEKEYQRFDNLMLRVIRPAVETINESSDIKLTITPINGNTCLFFEMSEKTKKKETPKKVKLESGETEQLKEIRLRNLKSEENRRREKCEFNHLTHLFSRLSKDDQLEHRKAYKSQTSMFGMSDSEDIFLDWWAQQAQITFPESIYIEV